MTTRRHVLAVPVDQALAYTAARGWHVLAAPPAGWLEEHSDLADLLEQHTDEQRRQRAQGAALTGWLGLTPEQRERRVQAATAARWDHVEDRTAATAPARAARWQRAG